VTTNKRIDKIYNSKGQRTITNSLVPFFLLDKGLKRLFLQASKAQILKEGLNVKKSQKKV